MLATVSMTAPALTGNDVKEWSGAVEVERGGDVVPVFQSSGGGGSKEVYYLANFKAVMEDCMLLSNPEGHVFSSDERAVVDRFNQLGCTYVITMKSWIYPVMVGKGMKEAHQCTLRHDERNHAIPKIVQALSYLFITSEIKS